MDEQAKHPAGWFEVDPLDNPDMVREELRALAAVVLERTDDYGYHGGPYNNRMVATAARDMLERLGVL